MSTGEEYIRAITRLEPDRRARAAFHALVLNITAPGACIFDFGAGPGIDAKFYAQQGFKVVAYDVDARMCASFAEDCRAAMDPQSNISDYLCAMSPVRTRTVGELRHNGALKFSVEAGHLPDLFPRDLSSESPCDGWRASPRRFCWRT